MKNSLSLPALILLITCGSICACSKSNGKSADTTLPPALANGYLTDGAWVLKGSYFKDDGYHPALLIDSLVITFSGMDSGNLFIDTVSTWFERIRSYDSEAHFITSSVPGTADTLFSGVTPYTFAFHPDTFLITNLTDTTFVFEQYSKGIITEEIDTFRKSGK